MSETMVVQEHVYDATIQITEMVDFGLDLKAIASKKAQIPPQGLRVNVAFKGELKGPKLQGTISGIDYLLMKPDGIGQLNVQAVITTSDGERIAQRGDGVLTPQQDSSVSQLRENIAFYSASSKYGWVNRMQFWASGTSDLSTGRILLKVFIA